jgi:hypothetical protein
MAESIAPSPPIVEPARPVATRRAVGTRRLHARWQSGDRVLQLGAMGSPSLEPRPARGPAGDGTSAAFGADLRPCHIAVARLAFKWSRSRAEG